MGGQSSLLDKPRREIDWEKKQESLLYVNNYKPLEQQIRILLHGQCGAGKSSFINSVQSVLRGRMYRQALAANTYGDSFTKKNRTYKIQKERPDNFYPFVFNDVMGLSKDKGVLVDDMKLSLQGHVKDSYRFNPESKLAEGDEFYNKAPTANDEVQVLVCVVAADTLSIMDKEVLRKFKEIREEATQRDIPQIAILTKVDAACPEVKKDLKNVYRSRYLKQLMEKFSVDVGIPMNSIFLVKNYHEEIDLNDNIDSLILSVLTNILNAGEDFVNMKLERKANIYEVKEIREEATQLNIPQLAILTKVDAACPEMKEDLKNVHRSKYLKEMMEKFSVDVGIHMASILPHEEIKLNDDIDLLILSVLKHIINAGEDFVKMKLETM